MAFGRHIYNALFRRTSTFALTIVIGAVLFERVFDQTLDNHYERVNQGVCIYVFQMCMCILFIRFSFVQYIYFILKIFECSLRAKDLLKEQFRTIG